jgi:hypothetical protein
MAAKVYNFDAGQWSMLPDAHVTDAVAQGSHAFEDGVQVPAMSPENQLTWIRGDRAQEAFQNGYRYATHDDGLAWEKAGRTASQDRIYGEGTGAEAFVQGVVGSVPGGNALVQGVAGGITGDREGIREGQEALSRNHPYLEAAGNVVGTIANPLTGVVGELGSALGEGAQGAIAAGLKGLGGEGAVAQLTAKAAGKGLGEAFTGTYFGLNDGINEASIGDPSQAAENLKTSIAAGALFGGKFGTSLGALEYGAPAIKKIASGTLGALQKAADWTAEKATNGYLTAALTLTGQKELLEAARGVIPLKEARVLEQKGGLDLVKRTVDEYEAAGKTLQKEGAVLMGGLKGSLKGQARELQDTVMGAVEKADGNLRETLDVLHADHESAEKALFQELQTAPPAWGSIHADTNKLTTGLADDFMKSGDANAKEFGKKMVGYLRAQESAFNIPSEVVDKALYQQVPASSEVKIALDLRDKAQNMLDGKKLPKSMQGDLQDFVDALSKKLQGHEQYGEAVTRMDQQQQALTGLRDFVQSTVGTSAARSPKNNIMFKMATDPAYRDRVSALFDQFPDVVPELQRFMTTSKDFGMQLEVVDGLNSRVKGMGRALTVPELEELVDGVLKGKSALGLPADGTDLASRIGRLREINEAVTAPTTNPFDKLRLTLGALGKEGPKDLPALIKQSEGIQAMARLRGNVEAGAAGSFLKEALMRYGTKAAIGAGVGALVGHDFGEGIPASIVGALGGAATGFITKPNSKVVSSLDTLTRLQRANEAATKTIDRNLQRAIDGVTGMGGRAQGAVVGAGTALKTMPKPVTRETFSDTADYLGKMGNPESRMDEVLGRLGAVQEAPNLTMALHSQYARDMDYVSSVMPRSPLAGQAINAAHDPWEPSDSELAAFNRRVAVAENPLVALDAVAAGTATPEHIEALQATAPGIYGRLQQGVLNAIMDPNTKLSYASRVQVANLFGVAADPSLQPQFVQAMQARFASGGGGGQQAPNQGMGTQMHVRANPKTQFDPSAMQTDADRATYSAV